MTRYTIETVLAESGRVEFVLVDRLTGERVAKGEHGEMRDLKRQLEKEAA